MNRLTTAIKHLIIVNVILFFAPRLMGMDLTRLLALYFPKNEYFGFWQYISHMFMHGSEFHILFNMYGLWAFGTPLEQMWGKNKFLFFYFSAGIGAGIIYSLVNYYQFNAAMEILLNTGVSKSEIFELLDPTVVYKNEHLQTLNQLYHTPAVGASGAVYGILVAFGFAFPNAKLALIFFPVPIAAKYFIPFMILGDLFFGVTKYSIGNIAHFAHIGGAIIGFIIAWYWKKNQFRIN
ncbi:rhomboid family intramembrane serine protease [Tenacibaculum sp. MEBiC06402]|uniref:rhomboid family intramembrane serine protease n=1 Tax=unclassified Tenacibaculum TaxID=2635139 RepID=UPI003B999C04